MIVESANYARSPNPAKVLKTMLPEPPRSEQLEPQKDIERYLMDRFKLLGLDAVSRTRIYLDTKFWALLRDEATGIRSSVVTRRLLTVLRERAANGAICTFSGHTLSEIMKHVSPTTQASTAALMDELSHGFCLANEERLLNNELVRWMYGLVNPGGERHPLAALAWAKPGYLLADLAPPDLPGLDAANQWAINTGFIDYMWDMPMAQVMEHIHRSNNPYPRLEWPAAAVDVINADVRKHDHENATKKLLYLSEIDGVLDWLGDMLTERYAEAAQAFGQPMPVTKADRISCQRILRHTIRMQASRSSIAHELPGIHIRAYLHAAIRWDKQRRFKANDLMDIEHAQTALPMCDFFFTDIPNAHLIKATKLDTTFRCTTIGSPEEALTALSA